MIRVGVTGGAGYVAGELLRLLLRHPDVEMAFVQSASHANQPLHIAHHDLVGETAMKFVGAWPGDQEIDLLFLCSGHAASRPFLDEHHIPADVRIIDMSSDFRLKESSTHQERTFIYGLPELHRTSITSAGAIANPGCFATAIQLGLLPLAAEQQLDHPVHINAITGSTGAGAGLSSTTHFSWREGNVSIYKPFTHQHLGEIRQSLGELQPDGSPPLHFIPVRGNFTRGILATLYTESSLSQEQLKELYSDYYADHPFTIITESSPDLKSVVNTNKCLIHLAKHEDQVLIVSTIDNLLKGAAGQAVQNMNLMFNLDERTGLGLKGSAF